MKVALDRGRRTPLHTSRLGSFHEPLPLCYERFQALTEILPCSPRGSKAPFSPSQTELALFISFIESVLFKFLARLFSHILHFPPCDGVDSFRFLLYDSPSLHAQGRLFLLPCSFPPAPCCCPAFNAPFRDCSLLAGAGFSNLGLRCLAFLLPTLCLRDTPPSPVACLSCQVPEP